MFDVGRSMFDVPFLPSTNFCTKEQKHAIARAIDSSKKSASTLEQLC
jgi:hypothetical protein